MFLRVPVVNGANINTAAAVTSLEISGDTATVTADCGDETCTVVLHGHSREKPRPGRVPGAGGLRFDQHGTGAEDEIVVQTG